MEAHGAAMVSDAGRMRPGADGRRSRCPGALPIARCGPPHYDRLMRPDLRRQTLPALLLGALLLGGATLTPPPAAASHLLLPREEEGSWLAADHELHFAASMAIAASWRVEGRDRASALALTAGIGLLKETYDATLKSRRLGERGMSRKDLVSDLLGAAAGLLLLRALNR